MILRLVLPSSKSELKTSASERLIQSNKHERARSIQTDRNTLKNSNKTSGLTQSSEVYLWRNKNIDEVKPVSIQTKTSFDMGSNTKTVSYKFNYY